MQNNSIPAEKDAEKSVLACILLDNKTATIAFNELAVGDFFFQENISIFDTMYSLFTEGKIIDTTTLVDLLKSRELLKKIGGFEYIAELYNLLPSSKKIRDYIEIVKAKALARQILDACEKIKDKVRGSESLEINELIEFAEHEIYDIATKKSSQEMAGIFDVVNGLIETIESRKHKKSDLTGMSSGYKYYDKLTQGFQPGELIILAARPAMGKSAFAVNLALNVAKNGKSVAIFSLEMGSDQVAMRMLSRETLINSMDLRSGNISDSDWPKFMAVSDKLKKYNIHFDDSSNVKISELYSKCRHLHQQKKLDFLVIDYLQLLSGSGATAGNRVNEIGEISRKLKSLARDLKIPVLALSQLSRSVESRQDKRPLMSDLRESGSIEQDADIVMFLYREEYYQNSQEIENNEPNNLEIVELDIKKNRSGGLGIVKLQFNKSCGHFMTYEEFNNSIDYTI